LASSKRRMRRMLSTMNRSPTFSVETLGSMKAMVRGIRAWSDISGERGGVKVKRRE
jgi:hypothetical protein